MEIKIYITEPRLIPTETFPERNRGTDSVKKETAENKGLTSPFLIISLRLSDKSMKIAKEEKMALDSEFRKRLANATQAELNVLSRKYPNGRGEIGAAVLIEQDSRFNMAKAAAKAKAKRDHQDGIKKRLDDWHNPDKWATKD